MTTKQAAELYSRLGKVAPPDIAAPSTEHIRNTRRKSVNGIAFRSTLEADSFQILDLWRKAGQITELELQPKFVLQPAFRREGIGLVRAMTYKADFSYRRDNAHFVIEAKGFRTEAYRMRRKLFLAKFPGVIFCEWTRETLRGMR